MFTPVTTHPCLRSDLCPSAVSGTDVVAVGWLNAQSITKKAVAIAEFISDRKLDVQAITETGHRAADDVSAYCNAAGFSSCRSGAQEQNWWRCRSDISVTL